MDVLFDISNGLVSVATDASSPRESALAIGEESELFQGSVHHQEAAWVSVRR